MEQDSGIRVDASSPGGDLIVPSDSVSQIGVPTGSTTPTTVTVEQLGTVVTGHTGSYNSSFMAVGPNKVKSEQDMLQLSETVVCDMFCGPARYLRRHVTEAAERKGFVTWLWSTFPARGDVQYTLASPVQMVPSFDEVGNLAPQKFHVACFAYDMWASLRPDPEVNVCKRIAAEILRDGFSTSGEPLLLKLCDVEEVKAAWGLEYSVANWPWAALTVGKEPLPAHSIGYIKGQSRCLTLLALLYLGYQDGFLDLATFLPKFYHSVLTVYGHVLAAMPVPGQVVLPSSSV